MFFTRMEKWEFDPQLRLHVEVSFDMILNPELILAVSSVCKWMCKWLWFES